MIWRTLAFLPFLFFAPLQGGAALAQAPVGKVVKYTRDTIPLYDDKGQKQGQVEARMLPKDAPVVRQGVGGTVGINWNGKVVYLNPLHVVVSQPDPCGSGSGVVPRDKDKAYAAASGPLGASAAQRCP